MIKFKCMRWTAAVAGAALALFLCGTHATDAQPALPAPSSQTAAYNTNGLMKWPTNFFLRNMGIVDVTDPWIGAALDGVTDDQAALQKAADYGGLIFVPFTTNGSLVGSSVIVKSNNFWTASGGKARFIMKQSFSSGYVFDTGTNSNISFNGIELDGSSNQTFAAVGSTGTRHGMSLYARGNINVKNCDVHGFSGTGILLTSPLATSATSLVLTNHNVTIEGTTVTRCFIGIAWDIASAEYTGGSDLTVLECGTGLNIDSGNVTIGGRSIIGLNNIGVYVGGNANNGHGSIVGALINHNTYPVFCLGTTIGFVFSGCQIFTGTVLLSGATGIQIVNGELDVAAITLQSGGSQNVISGNFCQGASANLITNPGLGWIYNNPKADGTWLGTPGIRGDGSTNLLTTASVIVSNGALTVSGAQGSLQVNGGSSNFVNRLQLGTNTTDLLFFGGVAESNGVIRMVGGDSPQFDFMTGKSNASARITYALVSTSKTANYQLLMTESGISVNNKGATIVTTNMLPNNPSNGVVYTVIIQTNLAVWLQGTNATIRYANLTTTNSGFLNSTNKGHVTVQAVSSNEWIVTSISITNGVPTWAFQ